MTEMRDQVSDNLIIRGKTPNNIKEICHELCANFISGVWKQISSYQIVIRRITGGYSNQIYHCSLPDKIKSINGEPQELVIRLYGEKHFETIFSENQRSNDVIISLMVSEYNLGPKLYGLFKEGEVQEYIKCHEFRLSEQKDLSMVIELARKLANVHSLKVPIRKAENWIIKTLNDNLNEANENFDIHKMMNDYNLDTLKNNSLETEIRWIAKCINATNCPNVFCHNDFRANNILVRDEEKKGNKIIFCDFEYSCYGNRGVDFGSLFAEWGTNYGKLEYLELGQFPDDTFLQTFFENYMNEYVKINGFNYASKEKNSIKQLLKEAKVFTLVSLLFSITFLMKVDGMTNKKKLMEGANFGLHKYFKLKNQFRKQIQSDPDYGKSSGL